MVTSRSVGILILLKSIPGALFCLVDASDAPAAASHAATLAPAVLSYICLQILFSTEDSRDVFFGSCYGVIHITGAVGLRFMFNISVIHHTELERFQHCVGDGGDIWSLFLRCPPKQHLSEGVQDEQKKQSESDGGGCAWSTQATCNRKRNSYKMCVREFYTLYYQFPHFVWQCLNGLEKLSRPCTRAVVPGLSTKE